MGAGIEQWGQCPERMGTRVGCLCETILAAIWPITVSARPSSMVVLMPWGGEDTRYFASGRSGFWPRTRHALASTFTARHKDGRESFSFSSTAGVVGAGAISSAWGPDAWERAGQHR